MPVPISGDPSLAAFGSSLTAITLAELGDKTFFMALILAVRHRARWVFIGAFGALTAVTLISLGLGYGLRELLPQAVVPWLAAVLFLVFGLKLLFDAQGMAADSAREEAAEAEEVVNAAETRHALTTPWAVIWESFALVFVAELGIAPSSPRFFWPPLRPGCSPSPACSPAPCSGMPWSPGWQWAPASGSVSA